MSRANRKRALYLGHFPQSGVQESTSLPFCFSSICLVQIFLCPSLLT